MKLTKKKPKKKELLIRIEMLEELTRAQRKDIEVLLKRTNELKALIEKFDGPRTDPGSHTCKTCDIILEKKTMCMRHDCPHMPVITFE